MILVTFVIGCSVTISSSVPDTDTYDAYAGGLVWDNWTTTSAGGTGSLPAGVTSQDFVRCKACHGWDTMGLNGGYVRRTATSSRPNPTVSADLSDSFDTVSLDDVWHTSGRSFSVEDTTMPAFDQAEGLTDEQASNVFEFLRTGPKLGDYATFDISTNPVVVTFSADTSASVGATLFTDNCSVCHTSLTEVVAGTLSTSLVSYFGGDGKFSEGFHKALYGIPNTSMTRTAVRSLTGQEVADIMAYIQSQL